MARSKRLTKNELPLSARESIAAKRQERGKVWERARGMWKDRKPDPIKELNQMRQEWEQRLEALEKPYGSTNK